MHSDTLVLKSIVCKAIVYKGGWKEVKQGRHCSFIENSVISQRPIIPTLPGDQVDEDKEEEANQTIKESEVLGIRKKRWTSKKYESSALPREPAR